MKQQDGFCDARLLTDVESGRGLMITNWESEVHMRANEASGWFKEQPARFQPVLGAPPSAERYEANVAT